MEEKEIIKGNPSNLKKILIGISILGLLLIICEGIKGDEQIHAEISKLINNRQMNKKEQTTIINNSSNAEEIQKYKDLLDNGTITKEEFEAKKKQLLGL